MTVLQTRVWPGLLPLTLAFGLTACSGEGMRKTFGLESTPPDAFAVGTQAPLSLPPEFGALPPPTPGAPRPQQEDAAQEGAEVVSPGTALTGAPSAASPGEQALLDQAGPTPPAGIRADVNQNALIASKPQGFVNNLMGTPPAPQPTVDAAAETHRLQENAALGQPVTTGGTPQDSNQKPGIFGRFLNLF